VGVTVKATHTPDARACHWNLFNASSGPYVYAHGRSQRIDGPKLQKGQAQAWDITIDPKGQSTWKIDGKAIAKLNPPRVDAAQLGKLALSVTLLGYGLRDEATEAYDDVVIIGTPRLSEDDDEGDDPDEGEPGDAVNAPPGGPDIERVDRLRRMDRRRDARPGRAR
jgi:hypothetical protein